MKMDDFDKEFAEMDRQYTIFSRFVFAFIAFVFVIGFSLIAVKVALVVWVLFHPEAAGAMVGGFFGAFFNGMFGG